MIKTIAFVTVVGLLVVTAAILIYAATTPDSFRVQRTARIMAPPETIFPLLVDLRRHGEWSPWERKDPAMKRSYSGAASGKGAIYEWDGDNNIGHGRMEITQATPPSHVVFDMHFIKPYEARNIAELTLEPQGDTTTVTWAIHGPKPYMAKLVHLFFNVDRMVGTEFETGLADLKALTEK